jgi:hypothetical protein
MEMALIFLNTSEACAQDHIDPQKFDLSQILPLLAI